MDPGAWAAYGQHYQRLGAGGVNPSGNPGQLNDLSLSASIPRQDGLGGYGAGAPPPLLLSHHGLNVSQGAHHHGDAGASYVNSGGLLTSGYDPMISAAFQGSAGKVGAGGHHHHHLPPLNMAHHGSAANLYKAMGGVKESDMGDLRGGFLRRGGMPASAMASSDPASMAGMGMATSPSGGLFNPQTTPPPSHHSWRHANMVPGAGASSSPFGVLPHEAVITRPDSSQDHRSKQNAARMMMDTGRYMEQDLVAQGYRNALAAAHQGGRASSAMMEHHHNAAAGQRGGTSLMMQAAGDPDALGLGLYSNSNMGAVSAAAAAAAAARGLLPPQNYLPQTHFSAVPSHQDLHGDKRDLYDLSMLGDKSHLDLFSGAGQQQQQQTPPSSTGGGGSASQSQRGSQRNSSSSSSSSHHHGRSSVGASTPNQRGAPTTTAAAHQSPATYTTYAVTSTAPSFTQSYMASPQPSPSLQQQNVHSPAPYTSALDFSNTVAQQHHHPSSPYPPTSSVLTHHGNSGGVDGSSPIYSSVITRATPSAQSSPSLPGVYGLHHKMGSSASANKQQQQQHHHESGKLPTPTPPPSHLAQQQQHGSGPMQRGSYDPTAGGDNCMADMVAANNHHNIPGGNLSRMVSTPTGSVGSNSGGGGGGGGGAPMSAAEHALMRSPSVSSGGPPTSAGGGGAAGRGSVDSCASPRSMSLSMDGSNVFHPQQMTLQDLADMSSSNDKMDIDGGGAGLLPPSAIVKSESLGGGGGNEEPHLMDLSQPHGQSMHHQQQQQQHHHQQHHHQMAPQMRGMYGGMKGGPPPLVEEKPAKKKKTRKKKKAEEEEAAAAAAAAAMRARMEATGPSSNGVPRSPMSLLPMGLQPLAGHGHHHQLGRPPMCPPPLEGQMYGHHQQQQHHHPSPSLRLGCMSSSPMMPGGNGYNPMGGMGSPHAMYGNEQGGGGPLQHQQQHHQQPIGVDACREGGSNVGGYNQNGGGGLAQSMDHQHHHHHHQQQQQQQQHNPHLHPPGQQQQHHHGGQQQHMMTSAQPASLAHPSSSSSSSPPLASLFDPLPTSPQGNAAAAAFEEQLRHEASQIAQRNLDRRGPSIEDDLGFLAELPPACNVAATSGVDRRPPMTGDTMSPPSVAAAVAAATSCKPGIAPPTAGTSSGVAGGAAGANFLDSFVRFLEGGEMFGEGSSTGGANPTAPARGGGSGRGRGKSRSEYTTPPQGKAVELNPATGLFVCAERGSRGGGGRGSHMNTNKFNNRRGGNANANVNKVMGRFGGAPANSMAGPLGGNREMTSLHSQMGLNFSSDEEEEQQQQQQQQHQIGGSCSGAGGMGNQGFVDSVKMALQSLSDNEGYAGDSSAHQAASSSPWSTNAPPSYGGHTTETNPACQPGAWGNPALAKNNEPSFAMYGQAKPAGHGMSPAMAGGATVGKAGRRPKDGGWGAGSCMDYGAQPSSDFNDKQTFFDLAAPVKKGAPAGRKGSPGSGGKSPKGKGDNGGYDLGSSSSSELDDKNRIFSPLSNPSWSQIGKEDSISHEVDSGKKRGSGLRGRRKGRPNLTPGGFPRGRPPGKRCKSIDEEKSDEEGSFKPKKPARGRGRPRLSDCIDMDEMENTIRQGSFRVGDFVLMVADKPLPEPPLYRIGQQHFLQKFEPFKDGDRTLHKSVHTYPAMKLGSKSLFEPIAVKILKGGAEDGVVEYLKDYKNSLANAVMRGRERAPAVSGQDEDDATAQKENFEVYLQTLISQVLDPNFISEIVKENDEYFLSHVHEIDGIVQKKKALLAKKIPWNTPMRDCADHFSVVTVHPFSAQGGCKLMCQACAKECVSLRKLHFEGQLYEYVTLGHTNEPPVGKKLEEREFALCTNCTDMVQVYSHLHHQKYNLFSMCANKVNSMRSSDPSLESHVILEQCLQDSAWINKLFLKIKNVWQACVVLCR